MAVADLRVIAQSLRTEIWVRERYGGTSLEHCKNLLAEAEKVLNKNPYEHLMGGVEFADPPEGDGPGGLDCDAED